MTPTQKGGHDGEAHQEGRQGRHQEGLLILILATAGLVLAACREPTAPSCGHVPPTWITPDSVMITICAVGPGGAR